MFHRRILFGVLLVVIVIGLIGLSGAAGYRAGLSQAYMMQWLAQPGNRGAFAIPPMYGGYWTGHFGLGPFFPGLGSLLLIGLLVLLGLAAFRAAAFHHRAGQAAGRHPTWARHGFRPGGPWGWWCEEQPKPQDAPKQPDAPSEPGKPAGGSGEATTAG